MNILFLAHNFNPSSGGVEKVTYNLSIEFVKRGSNVFFLQIYSNNRDNRPEENNIIPQFTINQTSQESLSEESMIFISTIITEKKINYIINQTPLFDRSLEITSFIRESFKEIKIISVFHNSPYCYKSIAHYYLKHFTIKNLKHYLGSLLRHQHLKKSLKKAYIISDKLCLLANSYIKECQSLLTSNSDNKLIAIPNPLTSFPVKNQQEKKNKIIFVGRLNVPEKNLIEMIRIFEKIYIKYPDWELEIIGDDSNIEDIKSYIKNKAIKSIKFLGHQTDLSKIYSEAKIICMTSIYEGWPMVIAEAQSYGCVPIIYDSFGAAIELINYGKAGILITKDNLNAFVIQLSRLIEDSDRLKKLQVQCTEYSKNWNVKYIVDQWEKLYNE